MAGYLTRFEDFYKVKSSYIEERSVSHELTVDVWHIL